MSELAAPLFAMDALRTVVEALGIEGLSVSALGLFAAAWYIHRASTVAGAAVGAASTTASTAKATTILLATGLGVGILKLDRARALEVLGSIRDWAVTEGARLLGRVIQSVL